MIKNKSTVAICIIAFALLVSSLIFGKKNTGKENKSEFASQAGPTPDSSSTYRGPIDDCLQNAALYRHGTHNTADCTMNYVHFYPDNIDMHSADSTTGDLKIGSYNLFHMGDNQAPLKNFGLIAEVMNQWDIVGIQEIMPLPSEWADANQGIVNLLASKGKDVTFPIGEKWNFAMPGYLHLLNELQKRDPSWAVILQPTPQGEGSTGEMAGFFYRSKRVGLKEWGYCPADQSVDIGTQKKVGNYGCLLQVPKEQRRLMSRVAFTAYFYAGNFDFVGVTTHVRFRKADTDQELKEQASDLCSFHANPDKCTPSKDDVGRFYEVAATANQFKSIREISHDKDIIFTGDFNLGFDDGNKDLWEAALKPAPGFAVTQTALTTLSIKAAKLASNYDHFIFDPQATSECDPSSIKPYDLTGADKSTDPIMKHVAKFFDPNMQKLLLQDSQNYIATLTKYQSGQGNAVGNLRPLTDKEKSALMKSDTDAADRMKLNKYGALMELLSDHIPISMRCHIGTSDDD